MTRTLPSFESSILVNTYIIHWAMRCDMFQFLHSLNTSWEVPPLRQQARRVSKVLLSIMVSPPINVKVVTLFNGDLADKI